MKKIQILSAVILFFTAFNFISCSDVEPLDPAIIIPTPTDPTDPENPTNPTNPTTGGSFKADFDGQTFTASSTLVYISGGSIIITATRTQGDSFGMIIEGTSTGTYPVNGNLIAYTPPGSEYGYEGTHPTDENANTGSVIITAVNTANKTISGTFQFTGFWSNFDETRPSKQFTNGVFTNLPYVSQNPTNDTFSATVNGASFNATDIFTAEVETGGISLISIGATNANDDNITVSVKPTLATGAYTITGNLDADGVQLTYATGALNNRARTGSINITLKTATRIAGSFTATVPLSVDNTKVITGNFDVAY